MAAFPVEFSHNLSNRSCEEIYLTVLQTQVVENSPQIVPNPSNPARFYSVNVWAWFSTVGSTAGDEIVAAKRLRFCVPSAVKFPASDLRLCMQSCATEWYLRVPQQFLMPSWAMKCNDFRRNDNFFEWILCVKLKILLAVRITVNCCQ